MRHRAQNWQLFDLALHRSGRCNLHIHISSATEKQGEALYNPTTITYTPDYRSVPDGLGTVTLENDTVVLITDTNYKFVNPTDYMNVVTIPFDTSEHWNKGRAALKDILNEMKVQRVYDPELAMELGNRIHYFEVDDFIKSTSA